MWPVSRVSLAVDLRRDGDADLLIEPVVDLGSDVRVPAGAVRLLGSPPHGAVLLPGGPGLPSDLVPGQGGCSSCRYGRSPRRAEKLLTAGSLRVPAADRGRFLTGFYPALHRALPVAPPTGRWSCRRCSLRSCACGSTTPGTTGCG
jgi:hypothetical protein